MPKKKKQREKSQTSFVEEDQTTTSSKCTLNSTVNQITLQNCQGIQIGDRNLLSLSGGTQTGASSGSTFGEAFGGSREELGVLFVKEILDQQDQPVVYADFEENVTAKLKTTGNKSFRELSGWHLEHFLVKHKNVFDIFRKKQIKFIRLKRKHITRRQKSQRSESLEDDIPSQDLQILQHDADEQSESTSDTNDELRTFLNEPTCSSTGDPIDNTWIEVKKKRKTVKKEKSDSTEIEQVEQIKRLRAVCNFDEGKFASLIKMGQSNDILYTEDTESYVNNPLLFSVDLVSMWNTPQRVHSYIIIGIAPGRAYGINEPLDDALFQNLFQDSYFSQKPIFRCYTAYHDEKMFGVVEISSSFGHGAPCAVKKSIEGEHICSEIGDIWIHKGTKNLFYKTTDLELSSIYHWFIGSSADKKVNTNGQDKAATPKKPVRSTTSKPKGNESEESSDANGSSLGRTFSFFWNSVTRFKKGHFVLFAGDVPNTTANLEALGLLPWICVYDFDIFSNSSGLLNVVQDKLEKERHLRLRTWKDPPENISEHGTRWCFMRGRQDLGDSRTDLEHNCVEDTNIWLKQVKTGLYSNCESLARFTEDYTVLTIVVLWPKNEKLLPFLLKSLDRLYETLTCSANIVICMEGEPTSERGKSRLQTLYEDFSSNMSVCRLSFELLCHGILNNMTVNEGKEVMYTLPKNEGHSSSPITEIDAAWLREDFEVLYLSNPYTRSSNDQDELDEEISTFYKGGNLHWYAWYMSSSLSKQIAIERTLMTKLEDKIRRHLDDFKTAVVSLYHSPGSGGTTLAQSVLWKFHEKVPSIHMKLRTGSTSDELDKKVSFLHDKTDLPVLILVDGEEDAKVRYLSRRLKCAVILNVKRYPYRIPTGDVKYAVFLSGFVTDQEANRLASKLGENRDEKKKKALDKLKDDVCEKGKRHYLFEFGMTIHLHEFKGIVSYVEGYLRLHELPHKAELAPWQTCLGYLALVYYYGQTSVPCQFFAALFGKPANYTMTLEEDFPYPFQEFVVYDNNESRRNNLRICHYIVAKEILEQLLSRHTGCTKERTDRLGYPACRNLSSLCINLIDYASKKKTKNQTLSTTIRFILTKTFIFRDDKDMSENEEQTRKKPVLSKLMIDIPGGKPLFTERLSVLQKLSSSFPEDPNFCAHLGRFFAYCRPDDEIEAEKCFKKAIQLCEKQRHGKRDEDIDEGLKLSLMHIYHMYGIVRQRYVSKFTRRSQRDKVVAFDEETIFFDRMEEIVPVAVEACDLFEKSRNITPETHQVNTYAYTGEIQVRLQICDFVLRYFASESGSRSISAFFASDAHEDCKSFVRESISTIENLILECFTDVDLVGDDVTTLRSNIAWYNSIFKKPVVSIQALPSDSSIGDRRLQIAAKKLKYGLNHNLTGIENISDENDIDEIIQLYEENFSDIQTYGFQGASRKKDLDREYREWMVAIRHEKFRKSYSLEYVLSHVEKWHEMVRSPFSTLYLFVLRSLIGFGTESVPGKTECLMDAISSREELARMTNLIIRPKYPREWLGYDGEGIKRLVPGKRHVGVCFEDGSDASVSLSDLAVCKGTILYPNTNKLSGMIDYKLDVNSVRVFFFPKVVNLEGKRFAGQRVEFNLAFSFQHGFEAYNVKLLKRYGCSSCRGKLEFTSVDTVLVCRCGHQVYKDEMNEVNE